MASGHALRRDLFHIGAAVKPHPFKQELVRYLSETTETGVKLATTELDPWGSAVSMRITCPACGDCSPSSRAMRSIRSGSRNDASSKLSARFISTRLSRCDFSASILYPYSMALKC